MKNTTDPAENSVFIAESNNAVHTILTAAGMAIYEEMHRRAAAGEDWSDTHEALKLEGEVATFANAEYCTGRLAQHITGTLEERVDWLQAFRAAGGIVKPATISGNGVPFSNQFYDGEEGHVLPVEKVCAMFHITPDMISLPHEAMAPVAPAPVA